MATANSNLAIGDKVYTKVIGYDANGNVTAGTDGANRVRSIGAAGSAAFTRPADTTAYTALDVIGGASSAIIEVPLGVPAGAEVQIDTIQLSIARGTATGITSIIAHLYTAAPAALVDNEPFRADAADDIFYVGSVLLGSASEVGGAFVFLSADSIGRKICLIGSNVFVVLQTSSGFTPLPAMGHVLRVLGIDLGACAPPPAIEPGTPILPGVFASALGGNYVRPTGGFRIGAAGARDFGISPPDAIHLPSGSLV